MEYKVNIFLDFNLMIEFNYGHEVGSLSAWQ